MCLVLGVIWVNVGIKWVNISVIWVNIVVKLVNISVIWVNLCVKWVNIGVKLVNIGVKWENISLIWVLMLVFQAGSTQMSERNESPETEEDYEQAEDMVCSIFSLNIRVFPKII